MKSSEEVSINTKLMLASYGDTTARMAKISRLNIKIGT